MRVNSALKGIFNNRLALGCGIAMVILIIFFIGSSFTKRSDHDLLAKQANLTIREIGHRLLLQAGDSTSRVLPVTEIHEGIFLLTFENEFVFNHDTLVALSQRLLSKSQLPSDYTVTVHECLKENIVYGFLISKTSPDILACSGRNQPAGCYSIEIAFQNFSEASIDYPFMSLACSSVMVLFSVALLIGRFRNGAVPVTSRDQQQAMAIIKENVPTHVPLGKFLFDVKGQRLQLGSEVINLTEKECRILELLNNHFGGLITRETLMQEVWINDGVITGRSLDMFVSKLRKKLSADPELKITNVHGKGYKLEIPEQDSLIAK
jgi:DNA-binding winged helix-turn-helix (wHTH) protein